MRVLPAVAIAVLLLLPAWPARAQDVMGHVRAERWAQATAEAAAHPDPVARKLLEWMRLLSPGQGRVDEIGAFIAANPDWPMQVSLARRRDEALALEPDLALARAECRRATPTLTAALLRCADALAAAGESATPLLAAAWATASGDAAWETRFIARWASVLTREDHVRRFEQLSWSDPAAARRQADRLDRPWQLLADARLALRRADPTAVAQARAVPLPQRGDPALFLDHARHLRRVGRDEEAVALWKAQGTAAERVVPEARRAPFWDERNLMARRRLRQGDDAGAYAVAAGHAQVGEPRTDAEFLAGFIALRRLKDPALATGHFRALSQASRAAITQGRAQYWLGRAAGSEAERREAFARAASWSSTFYGQLAALALERDAAGFAARMAAARDPQADSARALDLAGRELARAAAVLAGWGEKRRAAPFLLQLYEVSPDGPDRALAARLAAGLGLMETSVAIARRAGRDGVMLPEVGWPTLSSVTGQGAVLPVEPAMTLAIIRQESNFDVAAVSHAGARGLMQLMPATAAQVARGLGLAVPPLPALTGDPGLNVKLGTTYLRGLLDQFDANLALAAAGYNAGPRRVVEWIELNGDPRVPGTDIIDWIELIPFSETRNYVQRVVENTVLYRARLGGTAAGAHPHPLAPWLR